MKSRESHLRLRHFELDEKQRKVSDIELMISEFRRMTEDLDNQIAAEEQRAGVTDVDHFAYPPFAKAAVQRRDNLVNSIAELNDKLEEARQELETVSEELRKAELSVERAQDTNSGPRRGPRSNIGAKGSAFSRHVHRAC